MTVADLYLPESEVKECLSQAELLSTVARKELDAGRLLDSGGLIQLLPTRRLSLAAA